jgi:peptidyl-prolyl cis-trans isomerase D
MFDAVRKHQRLLQFVLLILILPAFVFFGISGYQGTSSRDTGLASVGGVPITQSEFDQAMRQRIDQMRQMMGDTLDAKLFDTPEARKEVLDGLIAQKAIAADAAQRKIVVTDEQVRQYILSVPGLRKPDGSFDEPRYKALLSSQNLTPAVFESRIRSELAMQALPDSVDGSAILPRSVRDAVAALQAEGREIRFLRFAAADYASRVNPGDAQIKAYYDGHQKEFETPESARIEYLVLSRESLADQVVVGEEDLKTYYEQNKSRFGVPEERRARHILVKASPEALEKAKELLARVKADPGQFAALAKSRSDDPGSASQGGDLGFFARGMMVKPFADAVFSIKDGDIVGPIETEFGQHIIQLTAVRPATEKSFESVRAEIDKEVRLQQAGQKFAESADSFTNTVYEQSDSLKPAADKYKLQIRSADGVTRQPSPGAAPGSPLANARLLSAIFNDDVVRNKRNTEAIEIAPGLMASARVVEYKPAQIRALDTVRDEVRQKVIAQEAGALAKAAAEARLAALKAGKSDDAGFSAPRAVTRATAEGLPAGAIEAVYRLPAQPLPTYGTVDLGADGHALVWLTRIIPAEQAMLALRQASIGQQLLRVVGQQDTVSYIDAIKARSKVERAADPVNKSGDARQP